MKKKLSIILLLLLICMPYFNISAASADHIIINHGCADWGRQDVEKVGTKICGKSVERLAKSKFL